MSLLQDLLGNKKQEGMVLFQSRFRNHRVVFGTVPVGTDPKGNTITKVIKAEFSNFVLALKNDAENAPLIELLRKGAGRDYVEVDFKKRHEEEQTKDKRIKELEQELESLRKSAVSAKGPKVRQSKTAPH